MKTIRKDHPASFFVFLSIIALLDGSTGCSKNDYYPTKLNPNISGGTQGANEVWISGSSFGPGTLTVPINTTVTWTNKDSYAHTVTSDVNMFNSGNMNSNASFSFQFTTKGSYAYHCAYHSGMTGTIIVE